ncbi:MAG: glycosyltransferase, partial [Patescibacteria group bacterium]|nr:glycosyltransferase [Patescibacteria group bacterium]
MNPVKVSVNSLTKNRAGLLKQALLSIERQTFSDYEVVVINDGSTDETGALLKDLKFKELKIINHEKSLGITASRQEALLASKGEYVAILDDDDEWLDPEKLAKQVKYLDEHKDCVLVGGGIRLKIEDAGFEEDTHRFRPEGDAQIRSTMLFRNNFFTSTVMFRREAAIRAGGFI